MSVVQLFNRERRAFKDFSAVNAENKQAWTRRHLRLRPLLPHRRVPQLHRHRSRHLVRRRAHRLNAPPCCGTVTLGVLIAFMQYAQRFFRPIQDLSEKYNILQAAMAASERVFKLLDSEPDDRIARPSRCLAMAPAASSSTTSGSPTRLSMKRSSPELSTATDEELNGFADIEWILRGVSFTIDPDETAAIVGHTGAGKTTITGLMMRFYDIQRGSILVDGVDVREQDLNHLRRRFGVVLQDPFLFTGTIADNIRLGSKWITDERLERAADEVNVGDFIRSLATQVRRARPRARRHPLHRPEAAHQLRPRPRARRPASSSSTRPPVRSTPTPNFASALRSRA